MTQGGGAGKPARDELYAHAARVELLLFDVDGVLTDGGLYYGPEGEAQKRFDVKDGHGLVMVRLAGLKAAVLTARKSSIVEVRGKELGLAAIYQGRKFKAPALTELLTELQVAPEAVAYMGDDVNDLAVMRRVGLPACPADAAPEVRAMALFVAQNPGGRGAARELCELVLKATGRWEGVLESMNGPPKATLAPLR